MNENGSSTVLGIIIIMVTSIIGLNLINNRINSFTDLQNKQKLLLCTKNINGKASKFIKKIQSTNKTIKILTIGKHLGSIIPFPGLKIASKAGIESSIKVIKVLQSKYVISFSNFLISTHLKHCSINKLALRTPFKQLFFIFKRNRYNQAIERGSKWIITTQKGRYQIKTEFNLKTRKVFSKIKEVNLFLRYL